MFTCLFFLLLASATGLDQWGSASDGFGEHVAFAVLISTWLFAIYLGLAAFKRGDPARCRRTAGAISSCLFVDFSLGALLGMPMYFWWNAVFLIVALLPIRASWKWRRIVSLGLAATLGGYLVAAAIFVPTYRSRIELRERYPIESLRERLNYVHKDPADNLASKTDVPVTSIAATNEVDALEERLRRQRTRDYFDSSTRSQFGFQNSREVFRQHRILSAAHAGFVRDFVDAIGFGPTRLGVIRIEDAFLVLPAPPTIPIPDVKSTPSSDSPGAPSAAAASRFASRFGTCISRVCSISRIKEVSAFRWREARIPSGTSISGSVFSRTASASSPNR